MKKILALLMISLLAVGVLTACSSDSDTTDATADSTTDSTTESSADDTAYPEKAINLVVPFAAGGDTDVNARIFAQYLSEELGVSVGVTNTSGAAGMLGAQQVIDSATDGYTVLWSHTEVLIPYIAGTSEIQIDDLDVAGIGMLTDTTVLAVSADSGITSIEELIAAAQAAPGEIEFAMSTGGYPHLIGIALEEELDVDFNLVNVGGNSDKITALLGGHTDVINVEYSLAKDYFENGDFICLAVLSEERNEYFPEIPTLVEMGYDVVFNKFFFCGFAEDTPTEIIEEFSAAMEAVVNNEEFQAACEEYFISPVYMNVAESLEYISGVNDTLSGYGELFRSEIEE